LALRTREGLAGEWSLRVLVAIAVSQHLGESDFPSGRVKDVRRRSRNSQRKRVDLMRCRWISNNRAQLTEIPPLWEGVQPPISLNMMLEGYTLLRPERTTFQMHVFKRLKYTLACCWNHKRIDWPPVSARARQVRLLLRRPKYA